MDKAVAQALHGLIPEFNSPLPQELLELAVSLLAQSRNKASSLKPEEEIARTCVCAHIACERLKQKLGLPKIQPRPPCPPKVYQKLHRYLVSTLAPGATRAARVPKPAGPATPSRTPNVTPRKAGTTSTRTPASTRSKRKREAAITEDVPAWVMPGIRGLCKRFKAPAAPPHIFAGVSSILTIPPPDAESVDNNHLKRLRNLSVEALVVAVYILVRTRLSGVETDPKDYTTQRDKAVAAMSELREDHDPLIELELSDVDSWMREIGQGRWTEMDWFENIGEGTGLAVNKPRAASNDTSLDSDVDEDDNLLLGRHKPAKYTAEKPYLQPGLGTMMQDRVDYLSDEKRADYQRWKKGILARIKQIENQQAQASAN